MTSPNKLAAAVAGGLLILPTSASSESAAAARPAQELGCEASPFVSQEIGSIAITFDIATNGDPDATVVTHRSPGAESWHLVAPAPHELPGSLPVDKRVADGTVLEVSLVSGPEAPEAYTTFLDPRAQAAARAACGTWIVSRVGGQTSLEQVG